MGRIVFEHQDAQDTPPSGSTAVYVKTDGEVYKKDSAGTESGIAEAATPLAHAATHVTGGTDILAEASDSVAGLMSCDKYAKLDGIETAADVTSAHDPKAHAASHKGDGADAIAVATTSVSGAMSGTDKTKLDGIATSADVTGSNAPQSHAASHGSGSGDAIKLDDLAAPDDNTDLDATTSKHGLLKKLGGGTSNFLRADGTWSAPPGGGGDNDKVGVDTGATPGYLGAAAGDGVLRVGSQLSYVDGGDFITLDVAEANIKLDDLGVPDDNTDLNASTSKHGLLPKLGGGTSNFLRADGTWAAAGGSAGPSELVYGRIRGENWTPTWAQLDAAGDMIVVNVRIVSNNFVGNATVAQINAMSPAQNQCCVVTDSGTIGFNSVTAGAVVVYFGISWMMVSSGTVSGYVASGTRLQLSSTIALLSPYTDGTDDGKIMSFDGTSLTGSEATEDITISLPYSGDLEDNDRCRGPIVIQRLGYASSSDGVVIVRPVSPYVFKDGLDAVHLLRDYETVSVIASPELGWNRTTKVENVFQAIRAATWAHTNFQTAAGIPWDTVGEAGSTEIMEIDSTNTNRINILHSGWYEISTFAQVDSTIIGLAYTVTAQLRTNGSTYLTESTVEIVNYEDENMYTSHASYVAFLGANTYIELVFWNNALAGSIDHARMTLKSLY